MHNVIRRSREERGSVILVMILVVTASMLALVTVSSVGAGLNRTRSDQTRSKAFQYANAGIDQALHRIETLGRVPPPASPTPSAGFQYTAVTSADGKVTKFSEAFTKDGIDYSVVAEQTPPGQTTVWRVNSTGRDASGTVRQAVANIKATSLFENGLFAINGFYITGQQFNNTDPVAYDSGACKPAAPLTNPSCNLPHPVPTRLGSNTGFPINAVPAIQSMIEQWAGFAVYGRKNVEDARDACGTNNKCHLQTGGTPPRPGDVINVPEPLTFTMPTITGSCPNGGRLGTGVKANATYPTPGQIAPGDYRCSRLTIQGVLTVTGDPSKNVRIMVDNELSIVPGKGNLPTKVNAQDRPQRFQVYLPEKADKSATSSSICSSEIWGLLYAPGLDLSCNGSGQTNIYGAVVAHRYSGTGNQFSFHWDATAATAVNDGKYRVYDWRECPVGTVDC